MLRIFSVGETDCICVCVSVCVRTNHAETLCACMRIFADACILVRAFVRVHVCARVRMPVVCARARACMYFEGKMKFVLKEHD